MSDVLALAAIAEARRRGRRVPEDLSVVGYDDVPEAARADPPLTTVAQPIVEKGRLAAHMIFDPRPAAEGNPAGLARPPRLDGTGARAALRPP